MSDRVTAPHIKCRYLLRGSLKNGEIAQRDHSGGTKPIASAMLKAATQIMGPIDHCAAADIDSDAGEKEQFEHLKKVWESVQTDEMIILLDIEGATPCNVLKKYISGKRCMVVSPLSFPLVLQNGSPIVR